MTRTSTAITSLSWKENLPSLLSALNSDILKEFIHRCIDGICGRKGPSEEKFCSSCSWTRSQFQEAVAGVQAFLIDCVKQSYDRKKIEEFLSLDDSQISSITNCISVRGDELQNFLLDSYQNGPTEVLSDYDWKLKWVMGSSSLSSLQETLLELDLMTVKRKRSELPLNAESQRQRIRVELNRDNVNTLINVLEKAQESA